MARKRGEALSMTVGEAKQRDVGKKRARIGPEAMDSLGISPGDFVEIASARSSCAVAWPADEDERSPETIRIDGQMRKNVGGARNEQVRVSRAEVRPARSVELMPVNDTMTVDSEFTDFVKARVSGMPVVEGDEVSVMILGNTISFRVSRVSPGGMVEVCDPTALSILTEAARDRRPRVTYEEVGGLGDEIKAMREIVELPLRHPELFARLGVEAHSGVLLYGPPGCGKTLIAKVLASESDANMYLINGPEIMNKYYGETEARLRDIFKEARDNSPSIIFIDEIDAIAPRREDVYGDVEKRVVAQLLALMDGLTERGNVIVLGATNRQDSVDPALRRPGRFDREVEVSVPNEDGRLEILQIHTRGMPVDAEFDIKEMASALHGYTGADIRSLCREAAIKAIRRYLPEIDLETERIPSAVLRSMRIRIVDFYEAMREVVPTAMREFYVERPKVWWGDVGGLGDAKRTLQQNVIRAMREPAEFARMGVRPPHGVLVYGPPGCGKTMLARALATESGANMIVVKGPEILSKWIGESERAIRDIFRKAVASSPCVLILDELDALARHRDGGDGGYGDTILSQLLTEIEDSLTASVVVVGITSRPDLLDGSLLRTGRLDLAIYTPPPDEAARLEIIGVLSRKMPLGDDVSLGEVAVMTRGCSGADLEALCREAAVAAIQRGSRAIEGQDFTAGLKRISPSITGDVGKWYDSVRSRVTNAVPGPHGREMYG
ncbi:MAG: CDC48 family AAA ATPase [Thaumarchaeota archaeon]|nr:CDC48 family AAA ATPase [Nitrososphaerota archaeon]RNJ71852.1 MAG: AAA family ATPase [Thaumarchaeota archaeon S13]RNJ73409.1 MAG: AAA family ATPase [Thaumarchaeota archaeon S14]RNJ76757.1 MAG: AAA family ATPase [Thaumarchaeota archaeon S15]MDD9813008.1 CDC48 family AAA ATPase [Nitrososphaerota archaeon]